MPELVHFNAKGAPETVRYHFLAPLFLSEVQKLEQTIDTQRRLITALESRPFRTGRPGEVDRP